MHSPIVVNSTSNSSTLHTASITTSHTPHISPSIPISSEAGILPTEHTTAVSTASYSTSCLPKLNIPTFSGDPLTW